MDGFVFGFTNLSIYPSVHGAANPAANPIVHGWTGDWASNSPSTIVVVASQNSTADDSSTSSDGGLTWRTMGIAATRCSRHELGRGHSRQHGHGSGFIYQSNNTPYVYYTTDGAATWRTAKISEVPTSGETGWGFAYYVNRQIVCADRVKANTFYAYNNGAPGNGKFAGVYKS